MIIFVSVEIWKSIRFYCLLELNITGLLLNNYICECGNLFLQTIMCFGAILHNANSQNGHCKCLCYQYET
jgi:hypothetical protein